MDGGLASGSFCLACGEDLRTKKGGRRSIGSASTQHVVPVLCHAAAHALAEAGNSRQLDEARFRDGYICRPCFREAERLQKLQQQVTTTREHLNANANNAIPYFPTLPLPPSDMTPSLHIPVQEAHSISSSEVEVGNTQYHQKRSLSPSQCEQGCWKRRRLQTSNQAVVSDNISSPPVSVSIMNS